MSRPARIDGPNTPRYKVVQGHFYPLVLHFEQDLTKIAAMLFEKKLIAINDFEQASNSNQPSFDRSSALLRRVLKKIHIKQSWYDVFIEVLHGIGELADITGEVETALKMEEESCNVLPGVLPSRPYPPRQPIKEHTRRHSDSEVIRSRLERTAEADSGLPEFLEEEVDDESVFDSEQVQGHDSSSKIAEASDVSRAELQVSPLTKRAASALVFSRGSTSGTAARDHIESATNGDIDLEDQDLTLPMQRTSSDGVSPPASAVPSFQNSNTWNREAENTYLKSQTQAQDSEISGLKKTIAELKEEQADSAEKLKQQGIVVSKKDGVIAGLKKKCKEKDDEIEELKKDKAEVERKIKDLETRCTEAEEKQEKSEEEIKRVHESYRAQLDGLQRNLEEVQSREKVAQIDLANARARLSDAMLEKVEEISKLREEFFKQERIKHELQLSKRNLEEEKKVEAAWKEKELALKDKELALKDRELAMKEKELAMKEKELLRAEKEKAVNLANQEAERAKEEAVSAKQDTKLANEGRRRSELQVQELEKKLDTLLQLSQKSEQ